MSWVRARLKDKNRYIQFLKSKINLNNQELNEAYKEYKKQLKLQFLAKKRENVIEGKFEDKIKNEKIKNKYEIKEEINEINNIIPIKDIIVNSQVDQDKIEVTITKLIDAEKPQDKLEDEIDQIPIIEISEEIKFGKTMHIDEIIPICSEPQPSSGIDVDENKKPQLTEEPVNKSEISEIIINNNKNMIRENQSQLSEVKWKRQQNIIKLGQLQNQLNLPNPYLSFGNQFLGYSNIILNQKELLEKEIKTLETYEQNLITKNVRCQEKINEETANRCRAIEEQKKEFKIKKNKNDKRKKEQEEKRLKVLKKIKESEDNKNKKIYYHEDENFDDDGIIYEVDTSRVRRKKYH